MSDQMEITDLRIIRGLCSGRVQGADETPPALRLEAGEITETVPTPRADGDGWVFEVALPMALISDGARAVVIVDAPSGAPLAQFALSVGEGLADDLRAEVEMLRAELDLLKAAFRREMRARD